MSGTAAIGGMVLDGQGRPIAGARGVISAWTDVNSGVNVATTASDGTYRIGELPAGHAQVAGIHALGYGPPGEKSPVLLLVAGEMAKPTCGSPPKRPSSEG